MHLVSTHIFVYLIELDMITIPENSHGYYLAYYTTTLMLSSLVFVIQTPEAFPHPGLDVHCCFRYAKVTISKCDGVTTRTTIFHLEHNPMVTLDYTSHTLSPVHRPRSHTLSPVHRPRSHTLSPVHRPRSHTLSPVHRPRSHTLSPVHCPRSHTLSPVHRPRSHTLSPVHRPRSHTLSPVHRPRSHTIARTSP